MPEGILAPFVVPRNIATPAPTPLADVPAPVTPASAPLKAASPQEANEVVPTYPAIPEPGQDLVSLQATVLRLKEGFEMMTGTRGGAENDVVGGYLLLQKATANSSARLEIINQVTANANFAMATHILILDAEFKAVTGVDPTGNTLKAHLEEQFLVYADADEALAFRALNMETALQMTTGTSASARLTSIESTNVSQGNVISVHSSQITTLDAQINTETIGIAARLQVTSSVAIQANGAAQEAIVKFGVRGTINEVSGGFTFSGVLKNDGTVGYFMEFEVDTFILRDPSSGGAKEVFSYFDGKFIFTGDVAIYGNLVVNGTIVTGKVAENAISNSSAASETIGTGAAGCTVGLTAREGAKLLITAMLVNGISSYAVSPYFGAYPMQFTKIRINGTHIFTLNMVNALIDNQYLGGSAYQFYRATLPSAAQFVYGPVSAGNYTIDILNDGVGYNLGYSLSVTELAR